MNGSEFSNFIVGTLIVIGSLLSLLSAFGLIRLPDIYTRSHAASKGTTLGILTVLIGTLIYFWSLNGYMSAKLVLGIFFVFITAPVGGHLLSRASYAMKIPLWEKSVRDDLRNKGK